MLKKVWLLCSLALISCATQKGQKSSSDDKRYTFGRGSYSQSLSDAKPRGGSSQGTKVEFADSNKNYDKLISTKGTGLEKDRAAILAMEGPYQATFEFLETIGFSKGYKLDRPYQSWGTEYVYVIENKPKLISLQHI